MKKKFISILQFIVGAACIPAIIMMFSHVGKQYSTGIKYPTNTFQEIEIDTIEGKATIGNLVFHLAYWEQKADSTIYYAHTPYMEQYLCLVHCNIAYMPPKEECQPNYFLFIIDQK